jgi:hypothetical protein
VEDDAAKGKKKFLWHNRFCRVIFSPRELSVGRGCFKIERKVVITKIARRLQARLPEFRAYHLGLPEFLHDPKHLCH